MSEKFTIKLKNIPKVGDTFQYSPILEKTTQSIDTQDILEVIRLDLDEEEVVLKNTKTNQEQIFQLDNFGALRENGALSLKKNV